MWFVQSIGVGCDRTGLQLSHMGQLISSQDPGMAVYLVGLSAGLTGCFHLLWLVWADKRDALDARYLLAQTTDINCFVSIRTVDVFAWIGQMDIV
jgi:hypothetical protein